MNLNGRIDRIREEVRRRALLFCCDNPRMLGNLHVIETAMLIGVSVVFEQPLDPDDDGHLEVTAEGEELLRQLFEGEPPSGVEHTLETVRPHLESVKG